MISNKGLLKEFKIVILGDSSVGKTCLIQRYTNKLYKDNYEPTVGASFFTNEVRTSLGSALVSIWDTAGQEQYKSLIPAYSRGADAAICCYDCTSLTSFESLDGWIKSLLDYAPEGVSVYIASTKCDLEEETVPEDKVSQWAQSRGFIMFKTSAKKDIGITQMFEKITTDLLLKKQKETDNQRNLIETSEKKSCC